MKKIKILIFFLLLSQNANAYHDKYFYDFGFWDKYEVKGSKNFYNFRKNLREDKSITKQIQKSKNSGLISYLMYENDEIVIDEKSNNDPLTRNNNGLLISNSIGKSLVSYLTGHAICEGYIESVNSKLNDWDLLKNTLYEGQELLDLLNMRAGDQKYIGTYYNDNDVKLSKKNININTIPLKYTLEYHLKNSTKSSKVYNYNGLSTNIVLNYVIFKSGKNFQNLINKVYRDHVKIKNSVFLLKNGNDPNDGTAWYQFYANRYDYLRIAKTILDDWNSNTCIGNYLKIIYKNKKSKNYKQSISNHPFLVPKSYGGQFHFDYNIRNTNILGMDGFGGQSILIDLKNSKIISVHANFTHYNWRNIVLNKMRR